MLKNDYIFWEEKASLQVGARTLGVDLNVSWHEWLDSQSQLNQHFALISREGFTAEQIKNLTSSEKVIICIPDPNDNTYLGGGYKPNPSKSFIQNVWELGSHISQILSCDDDGTCFWKDHYQEPNVWYRKKNDTIELLSREEFAKHNITEWKPVSLSGFLCWHWNQIPSLYKMLSASLLSQENKI